MLKKFNLLIFLIIICFIFLGTVSASDNLTDDVISLNNIQITDSNYNNYFNNEGYLLDSAVQSGDTVQLSGSFSNKKFIFNKSLNIEGVNSNIRDSSVVLLSSASGSSISNLHIRNTQANVQGIFLTGATNCRIYNNNIYNQGSSSYTICLDASSNYNNITNNILRTSGVNNPESQSGTRSTSVLVLGDSHHNYIAGNDLTVDDANIIYLSAYSGGSFKGGLSNFNIIYNNTLRCSVTPTSWNYAIQIMGSNNTADSNTIIGTYRGISSTNEGNIIVNNRLINLTGIDFLSGKQVGGDYAITAATNAYVANNTISNGFVKYGISVAEGSTVENNNVEIIENGFGIESNGNNVIIQNNEIRTDSGVGIYEIGKFSNLTVNANRITSNSGTGVLVKKSSNSKFPSNIKIINNNITTSYQYAINAGDADKESFIIENNNVGDSLILTPKGIVNPTDYIYTYNGTQYNITPTNYNEFFTQHGDISPFIKTGDILNFNGKFENKTMMITEGVKLTGNNPTFIDTTITVTSGDVWIENLSISNNNSKANNWPIYITGTSKVKVTNNNIDVNDSKSAYGIYIYQSDNLEVVGNNFTSHGDYLTYTILAYGVENAKILNNNIKTIGCGNLHLYEAEKCIDGENKVQEIYRTYGLLMIYSSDNIVSNNNISVTSLINRSSSYINGNFSTNSLAGIDIYYDSDNNIISNNNINIYGHDNYIYGAGVSGAPTGSGTSYSSENNRFLNNNIIVNGDYYATGLIIGHASKDTLLENNVINVASTNISYGINLELSQSTKVISNTINSRSQIIYSIELYNSNNNTLSNNEIKGNGIDVYGIAAINSNNNYVNNNLIESNGSSKNIKTRNYDSIKQGNAGISIQGVSSNNTIKENNITTAINYPVDLDVNSRNNTIISNYLKGQSASGDAGVNNSANNIVFNNYIYMFGDIILNNLTSPYLNKTMFILKTNTDGANVEFFIDYESIGNASVVNGTAILTYQLNEKYSTGNHYMEAIISKNLFKKETVNGVLTITQGKLDIEVVDLVTKSGVVSKITALIKNNLDKKVSGMVVLFYRENAYIGRAVSDKNGNATGTINIPSALTGSYNITAKIDSSANYLSSQGSGKLTIDNRVETRIIMPDIVMYYQDGTRLKVSIKDENNHTLSGVSVEITLNNIKYVKTSNANGSFSMSLKLNSGIYNVVARINSSNTYKNSQTTSKITIKTTVNGSDVTKIYRNQTQYYATFMDKTGKYLAKGIEVTFNINGVMYKRYINGDKGQAKLNLNLEQGTYILTAINPITGENAANTIKILPTIQKNKDVVKYYRNATQYIVQLVDTTGKAVGAGEKVTFNINGVFYTRQTNATGHAKLNINLQPGNYIITSEYKNCRVSNMIKVIPVITGNDLVKKYGQKGAFTVKLVDGQGKPLENANVTFNINGVLYKRMTHSGGIALLNINLQAGEYIITTSYNGANIANKVTVQT